ncbi:transcriptional regulator, AraC family [Lysobacter enzymogenes]|uniref:Transcriptional regulator, AraC family n=1 Tax=Lysobacter enzymogenes TaxID=69 RepID=A0A0S2DCL2_LYSEN|nr:AraC family transcriptional regulator [Lysobacter enzymogenes]ALN56274.1 transcriptional regulator, AraC family [Lysobacter enzymogenes]QCW25157.1 AraC family transcriptional regulator [Lysobacter enzymogenes]UZW59804.1 AraC family transcriptional regulator [Lysobacter enzymogenes]
MRQPSDQDGIDKGDAKGDVALMSPNLLWGLLETADRIGAPSDDWFAGTGLSRAQVSDPGVRLPDRPTAVVIERALKVLPPSIGLDIGRTQHVGNFGLLGLAMTTAATFGEALQIGLRFTPVVGSLMRFVESASESGTLALAGQMTIAFPSIHRFVAEEFFSSCLALARGLVGDKLRPQRLEFSYPEPEYRATYDEVFGCPLAFDQPQDRLVLDADWLAAPLPTHNPIASKQVLALCEAQMPSGAVPGEATAAVERLLRAQLPQDPKLTDIAAQMHVSERTLRRQLTGEGTSFHEIHDRLRIDRAYALLRERGPSIASVGAAIGYKDPRDFRRAFKRLTGETPRALRERLWTEMARERR